MKTMSEKTFRELMDAIPVPEGFTATYAKDERYLSKEAPLTFVLLKPDDTKIVYSITGDGHVSYKNGTGWYTFDRRGVSDSFYWRNWDGKPEAEYKECVTTALAEVAKKREFGKTAITLPGLGNHRVSPEGLEKLKVEMAKPGASRSFMPAGFGTGYTLTRQPRAPRYRGDRAAPRAKHELEALLGISPLYVDTFDAD